MKRSIWSISSATITSRIERELEFGYPLSKTSGGFALRIWRGSVKMANASYQIICELNCSLCMCILVPICAYWTLCKTKKTSARDKAIVPAGLLCRLIECLRIPISHRKQPHINHQHSPHFVPSFSVPTFFSFIPFCFLIEFFWSTISFVTRALNFIPTN